MKRFGGKVGGLGKKLAHGAGVSIDIGKGDDGDGGDGS